MRQRRRGASTCWTSIGAGTSCVALPFDQKSPFSSLFGSGAGSTGGFHRTASTAGCGGAVEGVGGEFGTGGGGGVFGVGGAARGVAATDGAAGAGGAGRGAAG